MKLIARTTPPLPPAPPYAHTVRIK